MPDLYPTDKEITIFGEKVKYPGLDQNGKFTNGSFTDPKQLASFIPAETLNLILDNLGEAIKSVGLEPNNIDTDQLAKALNIRTKNNIIQQEILEKLVLIDIEDGMNAPITLTPDENGIIYSQDINLKKSLSEKIGRKEEDIEIINFNLIPVISYKPDLEYVTSYFGNDLPDIDNTLIDYREKFLLSIKYPSMLPIVYELGIQVADDFTEDIKNYTPDSIIRDRMGDAIKYKAAFLSLMAATQGLAKKYTCLSASELFGVSEVVIKELISPTASQSINMFDSNYFFNRIIIESKQPPTLNVGSVANYDVSSKLLYGDNIKIRIKLFTGEFIKAFVYKGYDVAVRYKIINK